MPKAARDAWDTREPRIPTEAADEPLRVVDADALRVHAERLRQLGQIAAGVSHDLRNILNGMSLRLQQLERAGNQDPDDTAKTVGKLRRDLAFGVDVLERICDFGRIPRTNEAAPVELRELAHQACELSRMRMASRTPVSISETHEWAPRVRVRAAEVLSATVNLIINAIDASPASGSILVRTGGATSGSFIEVSDSGPGIPSEVLERLFEPFLTTKGRGGSGLGLCQVAACTKGHHGNVFVDTHPEHGTKFRLWFPVAHGTARPTHGESPLGDRAR